MEVDVCEIAANLILIFFTKTVPIPTEQNIITCTNTSMKKGLGISNTIF